MVFIGDELYTFDGAPGVRNVYYQLDFTNIGSTTIPNTVTSGPYLPIRDMGAIGDLIYLPTLEREFYVFDTGVAIVSFLRETHTFADYNGEPIRGLTYAEIPELQLLNIDTILCEGEEITLSIDLPNATFNWNTGSMDNNIVITEPGFYWVDLYLTAVHTFLILL